MSDVKLKWYQKKVMLIAVVGIIAATHLYEPKSNSTTALDLFLVVGATLWAIIIMAADKSPKNLLANHRRKARETNKDVFVHRDEDCGIDYWMTPKGVLEARYAKTVKLDLKGNEVICTDKASEQMVAESLIKLVHLVDSDLEIEDVFRGAIYGVDFENETFRMYRYCCCEEADCKFCGTDATGFLHKPSGSTVDWYKYIGKKGGMQIKLTVPFEDIYEDCVKSLQVQPERRLEAK